MLGTMRKISSGIISKLLLGLLVVSFGVWGIGDIIHTSGVSYVAKVGGHSIGLSEFQQQQGRVVRQMQAAGINVDPAKIQLAILRQMIQQKLVVQALHATGLFVDDMQVVKSLASDPKLQGLDGKFNDSAYHALLRQEGLTEAAFLSEIKMQSAGTFLLTSLDMQDVSPPASVVSLAATVDGETRDAVVVTIPATSSSTPTDEEIQQFYDESATTLYQQPERRTLEFVSPASDDITALIDKTITEEMIRDQMAAAPKTPKEKIIAQLRSQQRDSVIRDVSNQVEDAMAAGASLGEAVAKAGLRAQSRMLSNVTAEQFAQTKDDLSKTVTAQGFALAQGEVSHLISTPQGTFLFVGVKSITPASPKPLAEVRADVTRNVAQRNAREAGRKRAAEVKLALTDSKDWQAALSKLGIEGRTVQGITRPDATSKNDGPVPAALAQGIFELTVGKVAGPSSAEDGSQRLAYVLASHVASTAPSATNQEKAKKRVLAQLNGTVQARAFDTMAREQGVSINEAAFAQDRGQ